MQTNISLLGKKLINMKLLAIITVFIYLPFYNTTHKRILQKKEFNSDIYYETKYDINNITGTGDIFMDVAYRSVCYVKNCDSGCCIGKINEITCGETINCKTYEEHIYYLVSAPAALIPVCILFFLLIFVLIFTKRNEYSFCKSFILALICLAIITIPYVLYYARNPPLKKKEKK